MKNNRGFSLIEILVVVAIIGIISVTAIIKIGNNIDLAKKKSAENIMQQISLAQTEYYSDYSVYYTYSAGCSIPISDDTSSRDIEKELLGSNVTTPTIITNDIGFYMCIEKNGTSYNVIADDYFFKKRTPPCEITLNGINLGITRGSGC